MTVDLAVAKKVDVRFSVKRKLKFLLNLVSNIKTFLEG